MINLLFNLFAAGLVAAALAGVHAARSGRRQGARLLLAVPVLAIASAGAGSPGDLFGALQLLAWLIFLHLPLFLVGTAVLLWRTARTAATLAAVASAMLGAVALQAFQVEPRRLEVSRVEVRVAQLLAPLRIAVIADLQTDRPGDYELGAFRAVMASSPDLILLPGDYLQVRPSLYRQRAAELRRLLQRSRLGAPLGAYAVRGNVDPPALWPLAFAGTPVRPLSGTVHLDLGPLALTGLSLGDSFDTRLRLDRPGKPHVVFGHAPDFALGEVGADLLLAGHTHGGQVRLPLLGPLLTFSRVPRAWAAGATRLPGGRTLVVSRGVGMERGAAPRLRFLCRPEVVLVDLLPISPASAPTAPASS